MEVTLNKNSWHYQLVVHMNSRYYSVPENICGYGRAVVWAIIKTLSFVTCAVCAAGLLLCAPVMVFIGGFGIDGLANIIGTGEYGMFLQTSAVLGYGAYFVLWLAAITVVLRYIGLGFMYVCGLAVSKVREVIPPRQPKTSFLAEWYRSVKDKTCFQIKFED